MKQFYHVSESCITELTEQQALDINKDCDWINEALVFADDEAQALILAQEFDRGMRDRIDFFYPDSHGHLITALREAI